MTDEQIQKWYEEHKDQYLLPETVDLQYVELTARRPRARSTVTEQG